MSGEWNQVSAARCALGLAVAAIMVALLARASCAESSAPDAAAPTAGKRVVLLGFDGMDPRLVERWRDRLPNLRELLARSGGGALATTTPAESPVAWAAMITGRDPGETGIFDFLRHARRAADGTAPADFQVKPRYALYDVESQPITTSNERMIAACVAALVMIAVVLLLAALAGFFARVWRRRILALGLLLGLAAGGASAFKVWGWLELRAPVAIKRMDGRTFWEIASQSGIAARSLTVPMTFPATCECAADVRILAGLGVPDVRGTAGTYQAWSTRVDAPEEREFGGTMLPVTRDGERPITLTLGGPLDLKAHAESGERMTLEFVATPIGRDELALNMDGRELARLSPGEWSSTLRFDFKINPIVRVAGLARFYLAEMSGGEFTLYLSPIAFHPAEPPPTLGLSHPRSYSAELAGRLASDESTLWASAYETIGWAADTWGLADGVLDEPAFLADLGRSFAERRELLRSELAHRDQWQILSVVFEDVDRASHMLYRHLDPLHPAHRSVEAAAGVEALAAIYADADAIVGEVMAAFAGEADTLIMVVSDHGFASFRRGVDLNAWLVQEGYMVLSAPSPAERRLTLNSLFAGTGGFAQVDWNRTRAFALGLGTIYLNLRGLDPDGTVLPSEAEALAAEIAGRLMQMKDPAHPDAQVMASVAWKRARAGADVNDVDAHELVVRDPADPTKALAVTRWSRDAPELVVGFADGYRVSWQSTLGGVSGAVFADNTGAWSGDHCSVDPAAVPGIIACSHPLAAGERHVRDVTPTILSWLGVAVPDELRGVDLIE